MSARLDLTRFEKRSDAESLAMVVLHIVFVLAPVYLAAISGPGLHLILLWLWFGLGMNGLLNLLHECAHYHVFHNRTGSDILGRWIVGPMAVADFDSYRQRHWDHHRKLGQDDDPKTTYHSDIHGWKWFTYFLQCMFLIEGFKRFSVQTQGQDEHDPPILSVKAPPGQKGYPFWLVRVAIFQSLFCASLFAAAWSVRPDSPWKALLSSVIAYAVVYVYGLTSLTVFAAGIRAIAEHQIGSDGAKVIGQAALRNFSCNPVSRLFLGAYGFGEHATHHQEPAIPYYHLIAATTNLSEQDQALIPRKGYIATIWGLVLRPHAASGEGSNHAGPIVPAGETGVKEFSIR